MTVRSPDDVRIDVLPEPESPKHTQETLTQEVAHVEACVSHFFGNKCNDIFFINESDGCKIM